MRPCARGSASIPTHLCYDAGGPGQASSQSILVHPAPNSARLLRGAYQARPATATADVVPDWPERLRYILHAMLRKEIVSQDGGRGNYNEDAELERMVEAAYQSEIQNRGPFAIRPGGGKSIFQWAADSMARINLPD